MKFCCAHCRKMADKPTGEVNRARKSGLPLHCNRHCAGLARRKGKTKAQLVAEKKAYDAAYREKNFAVLKAKKHDYFKLTYDPAKAAVERKKRMPRHVEYCRQPRYKESKKEYDRKRRAGEFAAFADAYSLTLELDREIKRRFNHEEIKYENGGTNKAQRREREAGQGPSRNRHSASNG
jgi:hypothetical protein